jgi:ATP-binding cassette, subfamily B, bacterial MsbA
MSLKFSSLLRNLIKATGFWKENYLILREISYFPWVAFLAVASPIIAAIFEGFGISFLLGFLQNLVNGSEAFRTGIEWIDIYILNINGSELERLYRVSGLILLSTWLRAYFNYLTFVYMEMAKVRLTDRLYKQSFEQLQALSLSFFGNVRSGDIINTLTAEVAQLQQVINSLSFILAKGSVLVTYAGIALFISWQLCLIAILLFGLTAVGLTSLNRQVREASFPVSEARSRFTSLVTEFVNAIRTVQAFATQDFERRRYYAASSTVVKTTVVAARRLGVVRPLAEGIATTILIGMIIVGMSVFVANGSLQVAALLTFMFILFRLVPALQEINGCIAQISSYQGSIHSIQQLLDTTGKPYLKNGTRPFQTLTQGIEFAAVDFGYDPATPVLHNISLTIEKGQTVALVGTSGAGKSTIADLICRFYDPTQGKILLNGIDLREFDIQSVRRQMAIVSQDTFIFNASVKANIAYGSDNASEPAILQAAELANALGFIQDLPQGLETVLGDRGVRLSGGQRQRIAIARALLRNPELLILDEATSALDSVTEKLIQESLERLSSGKTVVAIAHRLSTIVNADKIIVLEKGRIVEQGSYQELLKQRGALWNYHKMQHGLNESENRDGSQPSSSSY